MSSSTSSSSFDALSESFEKVEMDSKDLKIQEQDALIRKLTEEMKQMRSKDSVWEKSILESVTGSWQIVSSIGMEDYLQKWKPLKICNALFQVGLQHFEFNEDTRVLTMYESIGTNEYNNIEAVLGEKVTVEAWTFSSFVENNQLVTVFFGDDDEEFGRVERVVKDQKLWVVVKRFGMSCTRIYERIGDQSNEEKLRRRVAELEGELLKAEKDARNVEERLERMLKQSEKRFKEDVHKLEEVHAKEVKKLKKEIEKETRFAEELLELNSNKSIMFGQMHEEIKKRQKKIDKLQKKVEDAEKKGLMEKEQIPDPESVKQGFLGLWTLQNPSLYSADIPRHLLFTIDDEGQLMEQNNGSICTRYTCKVRPAFGNLGFWGNNTYLEGNEMMSESYGKELHENYIITRRIKKQKLKMSINFLLRPVDLVYKKEQQ